MATFLYTLIIYPLYTIIECVFSLFNRFADNVGFCVIGVSVGVTLLCLPLYTVADKWQQIEHDKVKSMKPQLDRIKKCFSGDERYMMTTTYYRQCHYSPIMALRSSFGLLIQIPFFIAAYRFLSHLPALNGQSFLFIKDMGKPDNMFTIGSFSVNVLPIAMTLINCISGIIYSRGHGLREKVQIFGMAAIFLVILYNSPSGLVLYWTFNNIFSLVKNVFYKLKNPLKVFWLFCCITLIPFTVFLLFFTTTKWKYKIVYLFLVSIIYLMPILINKCTVLLHTHLASLIENHKSRLFLYAVSCTSLFLLIGLVIPGSLISSSAIDFANVGNHNNPILFISTSALQAAGFFIFWAFCIYFLFNKKIQSVLTLFMSVTAICYTLNTFLFSLPYGDISTSLIFLNPPSDFKTISFISIINLLASLAVFFLTLVLIQKKMSKIVSYLLTILCLTFVTIGIVNGSNIQSAYSAYIASGNKTSASEIKPIFHLSKTKQNIVVFMLDRAEGEFIHEIFNESPDLKELYSGFVHYNNCLSFNSHTFQGSTGLFGGYEYIPLEMNRRNTERLRDKHNQALLLLPRIFTEEKGFTAEVTDPSWANYNDYMDLTIFEPYPRIKAYQTAGVYNSLWYTDHKNQTGSMETSETLIDRNLVFFSFFRSAPIILRELIYKKGTWWSSDENTKDMSDYINWYAQLDFLPQLTEINEKDTGSYICMVNEASHSNVYLQAPDYTPVVEVTNFGNSKYKDLKEYHTTMASLKRVGTWIEYLKKNDAYDNTRIILVSDHGNPGSDEQMEANEELDKALFGGDHYGRGRFHCLLMVKDFGASGEMLEDQTTFMTNADVPSIALKGIVENPVNPFTNKPIPLDTTSLKKDGVIISANDKHVPVKHGKNTFSIEKDQWWLVKDNIFKSENWKKVNPFSE